MTQYNRPTKRPEGRFFGFHHCEFLVSNARQAADWMCLRFGFTRVGYLGLETSATPEVPNANGNKKSKVYNPVLSGRAYASHVVRQGRIVMTYTSPLMPISSESTAFIAKHGDAVKDVAFEVDDAKGIWKKAVDRGAISVKAPTVYEDENGQVIMASLKTYGDCIHTLVQRTTYSGPFLPGYIAVPSSDDPLNDELPEVGLLMTDHVVGNQDDGQMEVVANWYSKMLDFHRFWSVDDKQVHTEYSALRSIVMTDFDRVVKMPLNEPAKGKRKSQIKEYVEFHGDAGVQHIALRTRDIIASIRALRARGVKFLTIPKEYYDDLKERLKSSQIDVKEDLKVIEELNILVDFDDKGYLLQIFSEPVEDRPTLFYEVIQRHNNEGFGAGNFKALFTSIEKAQMKRGTSTPDAKL